MPIGVGAEAPVQQLAAPGGVVINPEAFFARTEPRTRSPITDDSLGVAGGAIQPRRLPSSGIHARLNITFEGVLTVTHLAGTVNTGPRWPYGLIDSYGMEADLRTDVFRVNGLDLHALKAARHPSSVLDTGAGRTDTIPGGMGAGGTIPDGASNIVLSWEIPIALDDALLIGSLFAQSDQVTIEQIIRQAVLSDLLVTTVDATVDSLTGTFTTSLDTYTLPMVGQSANGAGGGTSLVAPDVSVYHAVIAKEEPFTAAGDIAVSITRGAGQLDRLFIQVRESTDRAVITNPYLTTFPGADGIESVTLRYGAGNEPRIFDPAHVLRERASKHYGHELPYRYLVLDNLAENPPRDVINMPGVTDLEVVVQVGTGATVGAGNVRVVAEMLLQGQGSR